MDSSSPMASTSWAMPPSSAAGSNKTARNGRRRGAALHHSMNTCSQDLALVALFTGGVAGSPIARFRLDCGPMQTAPINCELPKPALYAALAEQLRAMLHGEPDWIANLANTAALLYDRLPALNWAGFYLCKDGELVVGPFQGKPACVRIAFGKGVCGTAAQRRSTLIVPNVHQFDGHIGCDSASNSEIVVPLVTPRGELRGVLDLDSPRFERFDEQDAAGLRVLVDILLGTLR